MKPKTLLPNPIAKIRCVREFKNCKKMAVKIQQPKDIKQANVEATKIVLEDPRIFLETFVAGSVVTKTYTIFKRT